VCVVMASGGYPGNYDKGHSISGLDEAAANGAVVFHAGTAREGAAIVTAGGRVLGVTATGPDIKAAVDKAYAAVAEIEWKGAIYRRDIAYRAIARLE
jgi:phosphoribosylamine--glycine ligase